MGDHKEGRRGREDVEGGEGRAWDGATGTFYGRITKRDSDWVISSGEGGALGYKEGGSLQTDQSVHTEIGTKRDTSLRGPKSCKEAVKWDKG